MIYYFDRLIELLKTAVADGKKPISWKVQHGLFVHLLAREHRFYHAAQWKKRRPATLLGLPYEVDDFPITEDFQLIVRDHNGIEVAVTPSATLHQCQF